MSKKQLLIIGASGHGKVVADAAVKMKKWNKIFFLDDDNKNKKILLGFDVIDKVANMDLYLKEYEIFVAIGNNEIRKKMFEKLISLDAQIPTIIHPEVAVGKEVEIELGTVIMGGSIINSGTKIGKGCIVNTGSTVDHDNIIEDFVHLSPGVNLAGTVKVGSGSWLGIGSVVSNNIKIARGCKIGAGAVVINNLIESGTYVGAPAVKID